MTLTKSDLIRVLSEQGVLKRRDSRLVVDNLFETIKDSLAEGDCLLISGFGKFSICDRGEKKVRNPRTGTEFLMSPRKVVTFKASPVLKRKINPR